MNRKTIEITKRAETAIKNGGLWIFANEFVTKVKTLEKGEWVDFASQGRFVGFGYVNPHSLITGRVLSRGEVDDRGALLKRLVQRSFERRANVAGFGSFRAVFSESDDLPGLIVDCYEDREKERIAVAQLTTAGMDAALDDVVAAVNQAMGEVIGKVGGLVIRADSSIRHLEGVENYVKVIAGEESLLAAGSAREDDVFFAADFVGGQKTGFFLDQRENRRHLAGQIRARCGLSVLDLCCYSGGWGLTALKAGARRVTFVDQSSEAIELVKRGTELNGFETSSARFVVKDAFDFLSEDTEKYDVVVCDPPAFVKSKKNIPQALRAYAKLNFMAMARLKSGGLLYTCSCSFHMSDQDFEKICLESVQKAGRIARVIDRRTQSLVDHPWILNRPESKYLKCLVLEID